MWSDQMASVKKMVQDTVSGKRERQPKLWEDNNIREWTGLDFNSSHRAAQDIGVRDGVSGGGGGGVVDPQKFGQIRHLFGTRQHICLTNCVTERNKYPYA